MKLVMIELRHSLECHFIDKCLYAGRKVERYFDKA